MSDRFTGRSIPYLGGSDCAIPLTVGDLVSTISRFATTTLLSWYRSHQDPERRLPLLSAYLGHVHVADTQWYLSCSPELMHEALLRLERCWERRP